MGILVILLQAMVGEIVEKSKGESLWAGFNDQAGEGKRP
jgi:hypothetical protein